MLFITLSCLFFQNVQGRRSRRQHWQAVSRVRSI